MLIAKVRHGIGYYILWSGKPNSEGLVVRVSHGRFIRLGTAILAVLLVLGGLGPDVFAHDKKGKKCRKRGKHHKKRGHKHCKKHKKHRKVEKVSFSWDPNDSNNDPNNLIVISGSLTRMGLLSDTTTDVSGELCGALVGRAKNVSNTSVTTTAGTTTITTSVDAKSRSGTDCKGSLAIDGEAFIVNCKLAGNQATMLDVEETFSGPTFSQTLNQSKLTLPVVITAYTPDHAKCFQGFGVIRREVTITSSGGSTITFATDELESELIGDTGLFELKLSRLQRIVEVPSP